MKYLKLGEWTKSSKSGPYSDNCVEVQAHGRTIHVRNSKNPTGPVVVFTHGEWEAFTEGIVAGEMRLP